MALVSFLSLQPAPGSSEKSRQPIKPTQTTFDWYEHILLSLKQVSFLLKQVSFLKTGGHPIIRHNPPPPPPPQRKAGSLLNRHKPHLTGMNTFYCHWSRCHFYWSRCHFWRQVATPSSGTTPPPPPPPPPTTTTTTTTTPSWHSNAWNMTGSVQRGFHMWPTFKPRVVQTCQQ